MMIGNFWVVDPETEEEVQAMNDVVFTIREKRQREELIRKCQRNIALAMEGSIDKIGLAETKTIMRALTRELRERELPD